MNYLVESMFNRLTTDDSFTVKVKNSNSQTHWLNISKAQLKTVIQALCDHELTTTIEWPVITYCRECGKELKT